jgi:hypothetical protein
MFYSVQVAGLLLEAQRTHHFRLGGQSPECTWREFKGIKGFWSSSMQIIRNQSLHLLSYSGSNKENVKKVAALN